jgi:hypothetical protein
MSNPLLRPNDPRFTKPSPFDSDGTNKFSEEKEVVAARAVNADGSVEPDAPAADNIYNSSAASTPYQPRYEVSQSHRGGLLLGLAITGLVSSLSGFLSLTGVWVLGWIPAFLAIVPAACALGLGWQDLRAIRLGAMDPRGETLTHLAFWLGALGVLASLAMDAAVLYFVIYYVMSLF